MNPSFKEKAEEIVRLIDGEIFNTISTKQRIVEALSEERENTLRLPEIGVLLELMQEVTADDCSWCLVEYNSESYSFDHMPDCEAKKALSNFNNLLGGKGVSNG